jgi:gliding motility-associated lipoprotein GldH
LIENSRKKQNVKIVKRKGLSQEEKIRAMNRIIVFLTFVVFIAFGCNRGRIFEKNVKFSDRIWNKDSAAVFDFEITDINSDYKFYFNLRNTILYPYQNIYLSYSLEDTLGNVYDSDLTNINLFDSKTGKPFGNGMGDIFDHQYLVIEDYQFNNPGLYQFRIKHYMRMDSLPEIMSVGLRIERSMSQ